MHRYLQAHFRLLPSATTAIHQAISPTRMNEYVRMANGDTEQALRLYLWNARICESLYFPMQILEVTVRNAISEAAEAARGPKWTKHKDILKQLDPHWMDQLRKVRGRINKSGQPVTTDRIIAGITFGFWCHLLAVRFTPILWKSGITSRFRHVPSSITQADILAELDRLSAYRNRIAHHKSMYDKLPEQILSDIIRVIGYRCPVSAHYVEATCPLDSIIAQRPNPADFA